MKKIFIIIGLLISSLLISLNSTYAVLIEQKFSFSLNSFELIDNQTSNIKLKTNMNLFDELDDFFNYEPESNKTYTVAIKKGPLTYNAKISYSYHYTWQTFIYKINIHMSEDEVFSISVFPQTQVITGHPSFPWSVTIHPNEALGGIVSLNHENYSTLMGNYDIYAMLESELDPDTGTNITDITNIPESIGTLSEAKSLSKVGLVYFDYDEINLFDTYIILNGEQYNLGKLELPGVEELNREPISPGIYWTENGKRYIYYEFKDNASSIPIDEQLNMFIDDPLQIKGFRPYVTMNLSDQTFIFINKLKLYSVVHDGGKGIAYVDTLFPMELDDLLAIEYEYNFRWEKFWGSSNPFGGGYTNWETTSINRYKGEVVDFKSTWQHVSNLVFSSVTAFIDIVESINGWSSGETITKLTSVTEDYKNNYVSKINTAEVKRGKTNTFNKDDIFTSSNSLYRIYLNTYNDGRYTGWEISDDIVILNVTYQYNGIIYHVPYDDIEQTNAGGESENDNFGEGAIQLLQFINSAMIWLTDNWILIGIIALIIIGLPLIAFLLNGVTAFTSSVKGLSNSFTRTRNRTRYNNASSSSNGLIVLLVISIIIIAIILFINGAI